MPHPPHRIGITKKAVSLFFVRTAFSIGESKCHAYELARPYGERAPVAMNSIKIAFFLAVESPQILKNHLDGYEMSQIKIYLSLEIFHQPVFLLFGL